VTSMSTVVEYEYSIDTVPARIREAILCFHHSSPSLSLEYGGIGVWVWGYGGMRVWEYGSMGYGGMRVWGYGSMGVWEYGSMGVWEYEGMGVWGYGYESTGDRCQMKRGHTRGCR
jgi:hypothetical protein